ncbi:LPD29 domain-containing protein [Pokkaliibacter plantistimulans]|uniref:LPD29 domain-containing protein n=1 Tax=Pokkaliibacter plantistimulans TaxID=1635171 RepID=UPI001057A014|nr:LPD29 domain-containing protein [Pokkaliibacter plantistimulans]
MNATDILAANKRFSDEVKRLSQATEYRHLQRTGAGDVYSTKLASRNIRASLKHRFPGHTFSVRMNGFTEIIVRWEGGPTRDEVHETIGAFRAGSYDTHQDMYIEHRTPWHQVFGSVKHIHLSHSRPARTEPGA